MKKLLVLVMMVAFAFSVTACATAKKGSMRVKCPACGYEFEGGGTGA